MICKRYISLRSFSLSLFPSLPCPTHRSLQHLHLKSFKQISTRQFPHHGASVHATYNSDRPLLPLSIPIQRYRYRPQPRSSTGTKGQAIDLIVRLLQTGETQPCRSVEAVYVEEMRGSQEGEMHGEESRVRLMRDEGGAEEESDDAE